MSKMMCKCGNAVGFNHAPLRYDGEVMTDARQGAVYDAITNEVAEFIAAIKDGLRDEWLSNFYNSVFEIPDDEVVSDIISNHWMPSALSIHQCEQCGRLWLERVPRANVWESYVPEGDWRGALEKPSEGFVAYPVGQDFFGTRIVNVRQEGGMAWVTLAGDKGRILEIPFIGVTAVKIHDDAIGKPVRFLSEWIDILPLRRFLFDGTSQYFEPLLEVTAEQMRL